MRGLRRRRLLLGLASAGASRLIEGHCSDSCYLARGPSADSRCFHHIYSRYSVEFLLTHCLRTTNRELEWIQQLSLINELGGLNFAKSVHTRERDNRADEPAARMWLVASLCGCSHSASLLRSPPFFLLSIHEASPPISTASDGPNIHCDIYFRKHRTKDSQRIVLSLTQLVLDRSH